MKKYLTVILLLGVMLLSSCSFPGENKPENTRDRSTETSDTVNNLMNTVKGLKDNTVDGTGNTKSETANGNSVIQRTDNGSDSQNQNQSKNQNENRNQNQDKSQSQNQDKSQNQNQSQNRNAIDNTGQNGNKSSTPNGMPAGKITFVLYYMDGEGYLIPVTRRLERQEGVARAALNGLVDSTLNREDMEYFGLYPVLPEGTAVLGINIKEGTAVVDFNNKLLNCVDEPSERRMISSVVYTLTEFKTIENVKILVNGLNAGKLKYGSDISGILNRKNVLINAQRVYIEPGFEKLDIFLFRNVAGRFNYLLPISVECESTGNEDMARKIFEMYASVQNDSRFFSEIPQGVRLLESHVDGNTVTLSFDGTIENYGGTATEDGIIKQILYSVRQIRGIEKVKILIDGKQGNLPEGTDISKPFAIPREINDFIDR